MLLLLLILLIFLSSSSLSATSGGGIGSGSFAEAAAAAWHVSPPRTDADWRQLASLVTRSFDAPPRRRRRRPYEDADGDGTADGAVVGIVNVDEDDDDEEEEDDDVASWNWWERLQTERYNYRHYVTTARRMRGLKYSVFVAKDGCVTDGGSGFGGKVVGVAEIGLKQQEHQQQQEDRQSFQQQQQMYCLPTIGSLCVDPDYRRMGIARGLVERCEELVRTTWNNGDGNDNHGRHDAIVAEVRVTNSDARRFFEACGYSAYGGGAAGFNDPPNQADEPPTVFVNVQHRRKLVAEPHFILSKSLLPDDRKNDTNDDEQTGREEGVSVVITVDSNDGGGDDGNAPPSRRKQWMW